VDLAGGIDILVNNASAIRFGPIGELSFADWSFTIRNELDIVFLVTRAAWPHLVAAGGGSIVNVASITASRGAFFMPQNAHGAAKGGVLALTYQLVVEGGPHGIRVNAVSPAMTETPQTAPLLHDPDGPGREHRRPRAAGPVGAAGGRRPGDLVPVLGRGVPRERREHSRRRRRGGGGVTASVEEARRQLAGRLLLRGEPGYEQARVGRVFNARRPDRFPAAVLLAADEDDVIAGVRLAAERGWTVSVRSGGHSWAAWSLRDDALLIDLGAMRDMAYEPASGVVSARPAVQGGLELAPFLAERGRAFPGGHCATVGLGGFLLQGGRAGTAGHAGGPARAWWAWTW
jgi:Dehydrogenases with different specificities (related to short-chain alcohol dehydrogenases)